MDIEPGNSSIPHRLSYFGDSISLFRDSMDYHVIPKLKIDIRRERQYCFQYPV